MTPDVTLTLSQARRVLGALFDSQAHVGQGVMLWGPPGVGKTSLVHRLASERGWPVYEIRLTTVSPADLMGLPVLRDGRTEFARPTLLPAEDAGDCVLFLDEITAAPAAVQVLAFGLLTERRAGPHRLPQSVRIVAAGNRMSDKSVAHRMPTALMNRLVHLHVWPDVQEWIEYVERLGDMHVDVKKYLLQFPNRLMGEPSDTTPFASPRSWHNLCRALRALEAQGITAEDKLARAVMNGIVGPAAAAEFIEFRRSFGRIPDARAILAGELDPNEVELPSDPDRMSVFVASLVEVAKEADSVENFLRVVRRLPRHFAVQALRDLSRDKPARKKLRSSPLWPALFDELREALAAAEEAAL